MPNSRSFSCRAYLLISYTRHSANRLVVSKLRALLPLAKPRCQRSGPYFRGTRCRSILRVSCRPCYRKQRASIARRRRGLAHAAAAAPANNTIHITFPASLPPQAFFIPYACATRAISRFLMRCRRRFSFGAWAACSQLTLFDRW